MNIEQLLEKINKLLEQLKEEMPQTKRIEIVSELQEILNQLFN